MMYEIQSRLDVLLIYILIQSKIEIIKKKIRFKFFTDLQNSKSHLVDLQI